MRFAPEVVSRLLALQIYKLTEKEIDGLLLQLCHDDINALEAAVRRLKS